MKNMSNNQYVRKANSKLGNETLMMIYVREKTNLIFLFPPKYCFHPQFWRNWCPDSPSLGNFMSNFIRSPHFDLVPR